MRISSPFHKFNAPKRPKPYIFIAILLIILFFSRQFNSSVPGKQKLSSELELAKHKYEEGKALVKINKIRAKNVLEESKFGLEKAILTLKKGQNEYEKAKELLKQIEKTLEKTKAVYKEKPKLFFDLSLIRDGLKAEKIKRSGDKLYLYSQSKKLIAAIDIKNRASSIIAGGGWLAKAGSFTASEGRQYVLVEKGIGQAQEEEKIVIEKDEEWGKVIDIEYFGGNLYLLSGKEGILKYAGAGDSFGSKTNYLKNDYKFENPSSMAIDGAVWVADSTTILKFIGGRRDSFYIRGLDKGFGRETQIVKAKDLNNLYLLDKENYRVIVVDEKGKFHGEYIWDQIDKVSGFAVSEEEKMIYLLIQDKIYSIKLQ